MSELEKNTSFEYSIRLFQDGNLILNKKFSDKTLIIGRDPGADLVVEDRSISRKHLQLDCENELIYVTDLGSSNGTYVDTKKIDTKVSVTERTHIRIGKIIFQVIPSLIRTPDKPVKEEQVATVAEPTAEPEEELTLSRIAQNVEEAVSKIEQKEISVIKSIEKISSMLDKNFVEEMVRQHKDSTTYPSKKIESLVLWNKQIYKINDFGHHEAIVIGPDYNDSIHIPSLPFRWSLSNYDFQEAVFRIPKNLNVFAIRGSNFLSAQQLLNEKRIKETQNSFHIQISFYDILRIEIDPQTQLYFRYVPSPVELDRKKLFDPDVLAKQAIIGSLILHFILALVLFLIPKDKIQTPVKKEPDRVAKLIVEEKPIVVPLPEEKKPEPPPPPPEEKKPEPPPPEKKKVEPPPPPKKLEPPKPKPKPKIEPKPKVQPKPVPLKKEPLPIKPAPQVAQKPVVPNQPVAPPAQKPLGTPKGDNKPSGPAPKAAPVVVQNPAPPAPTPPAPPPPKPVDITKLGALAAIGGLKLDAKSTKSVPTNVNIAANTTTNTNSEVGTAAIASELKTQTAGLAQSNSTNASGPIKTKGTGSVGGSYGTEGLGSGTGKRGVKGGVVGQPTLSSGKTVNGRPEGLSREQVLKAMQAYLGKIQSCYERSLLSDPNLSGRIEFEWNIAKSGNVTSVAIKKNSVAGGEQLGECVSNVIRSIKFPSAANGEETNPSIGFPFGRL